MTLAALQATLALYLKPEVALERIPTLRMLSEPLEELKARAEEMAAGLRDAIGIAGEAGDVSAGETGDVSKSDRMGEAASDETSAEPPATIDVEKATSKVGGGALPLLELDSWVCAVSPATMTVDELAARLRKTDPPVIGRIHKERLLLDARTVLPEQLAKIASSFTQALRETPEQPPASG
jgi:L-seryl-tRNA(Ser) seleniumtransferase